jgi:hypothetical protein
MYNRKNSRNGQKEIGGSPSVSSRAIAIWGSTAARLHRNLHLLRITVSGSSRRARERRLYLQTAYTIRVATDFAAAAG